MAPAEGRPAAGFLPVLTTVGRRSGPPGVLMLIVPRQVGRSGDLAGRVHMLGRRRSGRVYPR
ncbi:hypothetical protein D7223_22685 [Micromonospora endolithica]|uniref:Uncharacterized protein n=1 Tax=Micromonospora endolithica TaxID=230091 RepID=A0A3A9Z125_9ACTN|nr:hypothetical protein D7223_22685 [Micromonospora endolithica]